MKVSIFTNAVCLAEKSYVYNVLFAQHLGLDVEIQEKETLHTTVVLPTGAQLIFEDSFFKNENWLKNATVPNEPIFLEKNELNPFELIGVFGKPSIFKKGNSLHIGLDIMASTFFLLSRWEEFSNEKRDNHGRFPSEEAFLVRHGLHQKVWVERYAEAIEFWINAMGCAFESIKSKPSLQLSCDVDHPTQWPGTSPFSRGVMRVSKMIGGSLLKRKSWSEFNFWRQWKGDNDPFHTYGYLMDLAEKGQHLPVKFNFLAPDTGTPDALYPIERADILTIKRNIHTRGHIIGLHPSRAAATDAHILRSEKIRLENAFQKQLTTTRQHYLKTDMPYTFRNLADLDFDTDTSLGYADTVGFRCGTAKAFPMFDFLEKKVLSISQQPLVFMEVAPFKKTSSSPAEIEKVLTNLGKEVKKYNGRMTFLWHNSSIHTDFWEQYKPVFERFILDFKKL